MAGYDQTTCVTCANGNCICQGDQYLVESGGQLVCTPCGSGSYSYAGALNGDVPKYECMSCPLQGQVWDSTTFECACPTGTSARGSFCVDPASYASVTNDYNPDTQDQFSFRDAEVLANNDAAGSIPIGNSDTYSYLLPQALYECLQYQTKDQCQILANLCVYKMYDETAASCKALKNLQSTLASTNEFYDQWKEAVPWLYYTNSGADVAQNSGRVQATMSLSRDTPTDDKMNYLKFKVASYHLNGTFIRFEDLTTQLQLCSNSLDDGNEWRRFGVSLENSCDFDLTTLVKEKKPDNVNVFYEAFIEDFNGDLIDVPVLIENYIDATGATPNAENDKDAWKFTRRFFVFDTLAGMEGENEYLLQTVNATGVRWLHNVKLIVELDNDN